LWFVGPITFRRTLLQFLATVLKKAQYAPAMAGCSIAIHTLYGTSVAHYRPYTDDETGADDNSFDDLDRLAVFHSGVQVLLLIIGLCATAKNGEAIAVVAFIVIGIATIVTTVEIKRITDKNKKNGDDVEVEVEMSENAMELVEQPESAAELNLMSQLPTLPAARPPPRQLDQLQVPHGMRPGDTFQANIGGQIVSVQVPEELRASRMIQVTAAPAHV
jgi:hypothetical protein